MSLAVTETKEVCYNEFVLPVAPIQTSYRGSCLQRYGEPREAQAQNLTPDDLEGQSFKSFVISIQCPITYKTSCIVEQYATTECSVEAALSPTCSSPLKIGSFSFIPPTVKRYNIVREIKSCSLGVNAMALCKRCALNGAHRNGGDLGICKMHAKTKCQVCGAASLGAELCTAHTYQAELARWLAKSQLRVIDPEDTLDYEEIRREKLMQSKFLAHESVEVLFRALHGALQAIWGHPAIEPPPAAEEKRKAA